MSAMHWEARRRQALLDRRSRSKQVKEDPSQPIPKEHSGPDQPTQAGEDRGCVHCNGKSSGSVPSGGARTANRYNECRTLVLNLKARFNTESLQYTQQW